MELLISLGADRVLTSGQREKAMEGKELLKELQETYGSGIELLAGSGVNADNAAELMAYTGIWQVHSSCKAYYEDKTTVGEDVSYAYLPAPHERCYDGVSLEAVRRLTEVLQNDFEELIR